MFQIFYVVYNKLFLNPLNDQAGSTLSLDA